MSEKLEFQFEELDYQTAAVNAVIDLLKGLPRGSANSVYSNLSAIRSLGTADPSANTRFVAGGRLKENMRDIQYRNGLFKDKDIVGKTPNFTIEMETGTGKTFVYLKTILSLWQEYEGQFKKFIIVVPSNPILLGVKKSIEMLANYFKPQFQNIDLTNHYLVYDKNTDLNTVSQSFVENEDLSILILTYQSFNKDTNRLQTESEQGVILWQDIKDVSPIVIIDEPQKIDGTGKKKSRAMLKLEELNPPMILRYSATHKNLYNQIYKLDSYQAYTGHLVKGITVKTVHGLLPKDYPYVRYVRFTADLKARIEIFRSEQGKQVSFRQFDVENNASLFELSGGLEQYRDWYVAEQPHKLLPLKISCKNGELLELEKGKSNDEQTDINKTVEMQMRLAIKAHLDKQIEILENHLHIKALTLFFIDSVGKIRRSGADGRGEYLVMFDRIFDEIRTEPKYQMYFKSYPKELAILDPAMPVASVREGYFAVDKNRKPVDVDGWNSESNDEDVSLKAKAQEDVDRGIDLILNKKDELISFDEPLTFIFSHSALREGWDNPNVFTLVTLKQGSNDIAKKQEIGRGLRLPVDTYGKRCKIDEINELTVIANDYYDNFASSLQDDFNAKMGFDKDEVSSDIIRNTLVNAGVPEEKIEVACDALRKELREYGIVKLDKSGEKLVLAKEAEKIDSVIFNDPVLSEHSIKIIEQFKKLMIDKGTKRIPIKNGDNPSAVNGLQKYVTEDSFNKMYRKMLAILQKRTVYRYKFDKDKFIEEAANGINERLSKKIDYVTFEIEHSDVDFNDAHRMEMTSPDKSRENLEIPADEFAPKSDFELTNYLMKHTMLPRLAIFKILSKLTDENRKKMNSQDHLDEALSILSRLLIKSKSEFIDAQIVKAAPIPEKEIFSVDTVSDESEIRYLFKPNPIKKRALNQKYVLDSEGEMKFAEKLDEIEGVVMYTKLKKGGFVIDTPAGMYSPDWAIVYRDSNALALYFIAETKWSKSWEGLTADEKVKIKCAEKHFEAVNNEFSETIKYAWVNSVHNPESDNSFPEVFVGEQTGQITLPI